MIARAAATPDAPAPSGAGFFDARATTPDGVEADFVVVGSGAGGGAAARALARGGARVVVLEEGPRVATADLGSTALGTMATLFRNQGKQTAFGRATTPLLQARCVGGGTLVNSAIIWRLPEAVLASWRDRFGLGDGFAPAALEAAYETIEREMSVRPVVEGLTAGRQDALMRDGAARAMIDGRFLHRSERGCRASGRCLHGCPHEAKQSTAVNYLPRAVADGAAVYANAAVERVVIERGRAVAVIGRATASGGESAPGAPGQRRRFRVAARRAVIVCASAVQSPNLLRRSGVRREHLGDHFMAHPGTALLAFYPQPVGAWSGASQGFEALGLRDTLGAKMESVNVPPEVAAARLPGAGRRLAAFVDRLDHAAIWMVAVRAEAEGRIRPSVLFGDHVAYDLTAADMDRVRQGLRRLAEMHFLAGATEVVTGVHGLPELLRSIDEVRVFENAPLDPRAYSMVASHLFGGCRAGREPRLSVVDPDLKVHGVDGLYVMDASVFPTNTGVNPQHGIMAIATVAAERLVA
ncbi:MAG TPA: GMC family oxidoreductase [Polyangia bacterium]|nr:GMC family oxidoreductase [Polyangia bacterium]